MNPPIPQNPEPSAPPLGEIDIRTLKKLDDDPSRIILLELEEDLRKYTDKKMPFYNLLNEKIRLKRINISGYQEYIDNPLMNFEAQESAREHKAKGERVLNYYQKKQTNIQDEIVKKTMTLKFMRRYFY